MMRRGQVMLYLLMTIVVLAVVAFMNVDVFLAVRAKNRVQNGGDAATLAAARKQGELLNEIGRLNIRHIVAAAEDDAATCREIEQEQKRLTLLGPVEALRKANEAAKANGEVAREAFETLLREHVQTIRTVYSGGADSDGEPYPEPWQGAWVEYASAIESVLNEGLAVGPDNNEYYNALGGHLLLSKCFYSAIAGRCWCWFHFHAENALKNYGGWSSWGPLPSRKTNSIGNCEIFSLHLAARTGALTTTFSLEEIAALASSSAHGGKTISVETLKKSVEIHNPESVWLFFDSSAWDQWFNGLRLVGEEEDADATDFPLVGEVKRAYNVRGAAAACRCIRDVPAVLDERETEFTWFAAAKPFGQIEGEPVTTEKYRYFVLPVFEAVRLVPVDAVEGESLATADIDWIHHIRHHLPEYLQNGPNRRNGCTYCRNLVSWETSEFHQTGTLWLEKNAGTCRRGSGGSCNHHGGTRHGH